MIDGLLRWHNRRRAVRFELTLLTAAVEGLFGDDLVDKMNMFVVVVDKVSEQPVIGARELTNADGERAIGERRRRRGRFEAEVGFDAQHQRRAHDRDRSADETRDVLAADRAEGIDGPERCVDRP